jgi:thiol-disulfide isomerase/thioredoxin
MCDSSRDPDGLTETEREIKMAQEAELERQAELKRIEDQRIQQEIQRQQAEKRVEGVTDPAQRKRIEDCYQESLKPTLWGPPQATYLDKNLVCKYKTPEHEQCDREGGEYNPETKVCVPAGGFTQIQLTEQEKQAEIDKRILAARKKFMEEQYDLTAKIPGIKPNMYSSREQVINECATNHINSRRKARSIIKKGTTAGGMIECDALFTSENNPVFDILKAEEAKIIKEINEMTAPLQPLKPVEPEPGPGGLFNGDELEGWGMPTSLTLYWAKWCPHCHDILPMWKKLRHRGVQINALEEQETDFEVDGYPTIIFRNGSNMEKYNGKRTLAAIKKFLKNKLS